MRTLNDGRPDLDDFGARLGVGRLRPKTHDKSVERSLGGAVGGHWCRGDQGQVGTGEDQARGILLGLEMGQELHNQVNNAGEVRVDLLMEQVEVDPRWLGQVMLRLDARVDKDTVQVGVVLDGPVCC